jgi:DNA-binding XRE family transcriptional regulator
VEQTRLKVVSGWWNVTNNLRQADMIEYGFSERYIQKLESGTYSPNLYTVHRIAEALNVSVTDLFS